MFMIIKSEIKELRNRTVYIELFSERKIYYRVTEGITSRFGKEISTYGIEASDSRTGETEKISDFSPDVRDAVAFAELLSKHNIRPRQLYGKALGYLSKSI